MFQQQRCLGKGERNTREVSGDESEGEGKREGKGNGERETSRGKGENNKDRKVGMERERIGG